MKPLLIGLAAGAGVLAVGGLALAILLQVLPMDKDRKPPAPGGDQAKGKFKPPPPKDVKLPPDKGKKDPLQGLPAPELLPDFRLNAAPARLSELRGKVILVDFWAMWCPPCVEAFGHLRNWHARYQDEGLAVVGVTTYFEVFELDLASGLARKKKEKNPVPLTPAEEQQMVKTFASHHKLSYPIMVLSIDDWDKVGRDIDLDGIPMFLLIDRQGRIQHVQVGFEGPGDAAEMEKGIQRLLAGK